MSKMETTNEAFANNLFPFLCFFHVLVKIHSTTRHLVAMVAVAYVVILLTALETNLVICFLFAPKKNYIFRNRYNSITAWFGICSPLFKSHKQIVHLEIYFCRWIYKNKRRPRQQPHQVNNKYHSHFFPLAIRFITAPIIIYLFHKQSTCECDVDGSYISNTYFSLFPPFFRSHPNK